VSGRTVTVRLQASARELGLASLERAERAGAPPSEADRAAAFAATLGRVQLRQDGAPCGFTAGKLLPEPPDGFTVDGTFTCPRAVERVEVALGFLASLPQGHTHLARVHAGGAVEQHVVRATTPTFAIAQSEPTWRRALAFVVLGIEHILTGFDHLAFLLAVLLVAPTLRSVVPIVTSFTVAHSITLAAAASGAVSVSPRLVEPLIAASVVLVALENLWLARRGASEEIRRRGLQRRWAITFCFGLVHGLGFAGALLDLHLSGRTLVLALIGFNAGVEVGQISVAAVILPVVFLLRRRGAAAGAVRAGSAAVALLGAVWLAQRVAAAG
jgi:hypothetical protein